MSEPCPPEPGLPRATVADIAPRAVRRRRWRVGLLVGTGVLAAAGLSLPPLIEQARAAEDKAILGRLAQIGAAVDQLSTEHPHRIFFSYDEVVGETRYLRSLHPQYGEDYRVLFPLRRSPLDDERWIGPDGKPVSPVSSLRVTRRSGRVVQRWFGARPGGELADGIYTQHVRGGRYDVAYRDGVPHGPFRAFYGDGAVWGETRYEAGRQTGPSWIFTRDGRKFDELREPEAAQAAIGRSIKQAADPDRDEGLRKLEGGDPGAAVAAFTRALAIDAHDRESLRGRARAHRALGNFDGAIGDMERALGALRLDSGDDLAHRELEELWLQRAKQREANGDAVGAAADRKRVANAYFQLGVHLHLNRRMAALVPALTRGLELWETADAYLLRAEAQVHTGAAAPALADLTKAAALAKEGRFWEVRTNPQFDAQLHYVRGHARRMAGDDLGAAADFRLVRERRPFDVVRRYQVSMWLFLTQLEAGRREAAVQELEADLLRAKELAWSESDIELVRLTLGRITAQECGGKIVHPPSRPQAYLVHFHEALRRRLAGDETGAQAEFLEATKVRRPIRYELEVQFAQRAARLR